MTRHDALLDLFRGMGQYLDKEKLRVYAGVTRELSDNELSVGVARMLRDSGIERFPTAGQLLRYCRPDRRDTAAPVAKSAPDPAIANLASFGGEMTTLLCWSCQKEFEHFQGYADRLAKLREVGERAPLLCCACVKIHLDSIPSQPHRRGHT